MQHKQTKTLLVNTITAAVVVGVFVAGYFVFVKEDTDPTTKEIVVARIAEETTSIGAEIDYTVRILEDLDIAVASSRIIFDLPAFRNLQNFTVEIPAEAIGRVNPFVPTDWKLKMKAQEKNTAKTATSTSESDAPASAPQPAPPSVPKPAPVSGVQTQAQAQALKTSGGTSCFGHTLISL